MVLVLARDGFPPPAPQLELQPLPRGEGGAAALVRLAAAALLLPAGGQTGRSVRGGAEGGEVRLHQRVALEQARRQGNEDQDRVPGDQTMR